MAGFSKNKKEVFLKAAMVIAELDTFGETITRQKHKLDKKRLQYFKKLVRVNQEAFGLYIQERERLKNNWSNLAAGAIAKGLEALAETFVKLDREDPDNIRVITDSLRVLSEAMTMSQLIDAKISTLQQDQPKMMESSKALAIMGDEYPEGMDFVDGEVVVVEPEAESVEA